MNNQVITLNDQQLESINGGFLTTALKVAGKIVKPIVYAEGAESIIKKTLSTGEA